MPKILSIREMKHKRGEIIGKHLDELCQNDFLCNKPKQIQDEVK